MLRSKERLVFELSIKCIVVGDSGAGKTSIIRQFTQNTFLGQPVQSFGDQFSEKRITLGDTPVCIEIGDIGGAQESICPSRTITCSSYRYVESVIIVFDATNPIQFEQIESWIKEVKTQASKTAQIILVRNKIDSEDCKVTAEEAQEMANKYNILYIGTSAKLNDNIEFLFQSVAQNAVDRTVNQRVITTKYSPSKPRTHKKKRRSCDKILERFKSIASRPMNN